MHRLLLRISVGGDSTASLGTLCQFSVTGVPYARVWMFYFVY